MSAIDDRLNLKLPIWNAGMGLGIAGAAMASAVCAAGGLGVLGLGSMRPAQMRDEIERLRALTSRAFGVNLIMPMMQEGQIDVCFDERVPLMILFWGDPAPFVKDAHRRDILLVSQCGDAEEALCAADAGVDAVIVQGTEAGGHVKATHPLGDVVVDSARALGSLPVIASGGIANGDDINKALQLGACAVSMGTRFLATHEAAVQPAYKDRVIAARSEQTVMTKLFDVGWPDAAHRVLRNRAYDNWEAAGRAPSGSRPGEGEVVAHLKLSDEVMDIPRYSVVPPMEIYEGDVEEAALYCGQSCDRIDALASTAALMEQLARELDTARS